jgi:hypothetical protein
LCRFILAHFFFFVTYIVWRAIKKASVKTEAVNFG